jgi:hypothetical protein
MRQASAIWSARQLFGRRRFYRFMKQPIKSLATKATIWNSPGFVDSYGLTDSSCSLVLLS